MISRIEFLLVVLLVCSLSLYVASENDVEDSGEHQRLEPPDSGHAHCSHEHPTPSEVVLGVHLEPAHIVKKRDISQPFRIAVFYDRSVKRLTRSKFHLINVRVIPEAVRFWERTLTVRKTSGPITLNRRCESEAVFVRDNRTYCVETCSKLTKCGDVPVPQEHLNPCLVCNSTGGQCRALSRQEMAAAGMLDAKDPGLPENDSALGVNETDFVLYVSAMETERCQRVRTVAYAVHCQQEAALDRPVAGQVNFCPSALSSAPRDLSALLAALHHEMLHALAFSASLYAFYRDDRGEPLTRRIPETGAPPLDPRRQVHAWSDTIVREVTRARWLVRGGFSPRRLQMLVTPRVRAEVQRHFNCSQLEGAELEDQGGPGVALTHFEKRVFENELMTGTHAHTSVLSRVTLAALEDSGWYRADYSQAQPLLWGQGLGCAFVMASCKEWFNFKRLKRKSPSPFCDRVKQDPLRTSCSPKRTAVTICNLVRHQRSLPSQYQHLEYIEGVAAGQEAFYGGAVALADYCPYQQELRWRSPESSAARGSRCDVPTNAPQPDSNFALEDYGPGSLCIDHVDHPWEQRSCRQVREWQHWGSGCYRYRCENGRLNILVGNYSYTCMHAGQVLRIKVRRQGWLHRGALLCPPCSHICQKYFEERGELCRGGEEAPPSTQYPYDELVCAAAPSISQVTYAVLLFAILWHQASSP